MSHDPAAAPAPSDFIRDIVAADVAAGKVQRVVTRFPPEPNGYLHIGHAKSICLNFGIAHEFGGVCNLRMDDTNPAKEDVEYVESIIEDVKWLIGGWADHVLRFKRVGDTSGRAAEPGEPDTEPFYASDYFQQLHDYAVHADQGGQGLRLRSRRRSRPMLYPRRARRGRAALAVSRAQRRGESRSLRADESRRVPRWRAHAAREDRHGRAEHLAARSGALPHPPHVASPHRRRVVHLPDVRLRALPERCDRRHHAQHLHAGVRGPPAALRLAHRAICRCRSRARTSTSSRG